MTFHSVLYNSWLFLHALGACWTYLDPGGSALTLWKVLPSPGTNLYDIYYLPDIVLITYKYKL
jgi:hypothetical protein